MKTQVWFGNIEFGDFVKGRDSYPCALVHDISEKAMLSEEEADDYMVAHHYDSYLIPSLFKGEIYYRGQK
jgi:hypothetical protein